MSDSESTVWDFPVNLPEPAPELSEDKHDDVEGMRFGVHLVVGAFIISAAISIGAIALLVSLIHGLVTR